MFQDFWQGLCNSNIPGAGNFGNMKTLTTDSLVFSLVLKGSCLYISKLCAISFSYNNDVISSTLLKIERIRRSKFEK